jgi:hypothetical protein
MLKLWLIYAGDPGPQLERVEVTKDKRLGSTVDDAFIRATASDEIGGRR